MKQTRPRTRTRHVLIICMLRGSFTCFDFYDCRPSILLAVHEHVDRTIIMMKVKKKVKEALRMRAQRGSEGIHST